VSSYPSRRQFLQTSAAALAAAGLPVWGASTRAQAALFQSKNDRPLIGCIGTGSRWGAVGPAAMQFGDCVAVCDVDSRRTAQAKQRVQQIQDQKGSPKEVAVYEDYRKLLDDKNIDVVTIVTTDHWHTKIALAALEAGKDVYCEKPLTLTIAEGKLIDEAVKRTGRVFQVGTQQRSEMGLRFLHAVAIIREGRIGKLQRVTCAIGGSPTSGPIPVADVPQGLNWDMWLGQAPLVEYRDNGKGKTRCHYEFRWWYEYSGGKLTDWGAHHVDIAQWAMDQAGEGQGPSQIDPVMAVHPVPFKDGYPTDETQYNCATKFRVVCQFPDTVLEIRDEANDLGFDNGILFEGTEGRIFVNRGKLTGKAVEELKDKPLKEETLRALYKGKQPGNHMGNFFECLRDRSQPISDVFTHNRALNTCHLANIAIRLGRKLTWNPVTLQIEGDEEANRWQTREQRKGYEVSSV